MKGYLKAVRDTLDRNKNWLIVWLVIVSVIVGINVITSPYPNGTRIWISHIDGLSDRKVRGATVIGSGYYKNGLAVSREYVIQTDGGERITIVSDNIVGKMDDVK